jgi:hypothetical protein
VPYHDDAVTPEDRDNPDHQLTRRKNVFELSAAKVCPDVSVAEVVNRRKGCNIINPKSILWVR